MHDLVQRGNQELAHFLHRLRRRYGPCVREAVQQNAQTVEVVGMPVRYINDPQVAVMQRNPIRESLGLSHRSQCVYQYRVVLTEDQSRCHWIEAERFAKGPWPLAYHRLSRRGKDVDTKRVRRSGCHVRSLLKFIMMFLSIPDAFTNACPPARSIEQKSRCQRYPARFPRCLPSLSSRNGFQGS